MGLDLAAVQITFQWPQCYSKFSFLIFAINHVLAALLQSLNTSPRHHLTFPLPHQLGSTYSTVCWPKKRFSHFPCLPSALQSDPIGHVRLSTPPPTPGTFLTFATLDKLENSRILSATLVWKPAIKRSKLKPKTQQSQLAQKKRKTQHTYCRFDS